MRLSVRLSRGGRDSLGDDGPTTPVIKQGLNTIQLRHIEIRESARYSAAMDLRSEVWNAVLDLCCSVPGQICVSLCLFPCSQEGPCKTGAV